VGVFRKTVKEYNGFSLWRSRVKDAEFQVS
jgi:hypothetical protein